MSRSLLRLLGVCTFALAALSVLVTVAGPAVGQAPLPISVRPGGLSVLNQSNTYGPFVAPGPLRPSLQNLGGVMGMQGGMGGGMQGGMMGMQGGMMGGGKIGFSGGTGL